jgi:hypothetical protein
MKTEKRGGARENSGRKWIIKNKKQITVQISLHKKAEILKAIKELNEYQYKS